MNERQILAWVPFDRALLGEVPANVDVEIVAATPPQKSLDEVVFWAPDITKSIPYADVLPRMERLDVLQLTSAGVETLLEHVPRHVTLCNGSGINASAVAELGVGLILASLRGIDKFVHLQNRGIWDTIAHQASSLVGRSVLIVGYGSIGACLERRLAGFECSVQRVARTARPGVHSVDELPNLLPRADIVVLLTPLTDQTHGLVDSRFLARMQDGALLVNLARGAVVDTDALLSESGRIRAALDVTDPEPLPVGHPLWSAPGVLISPHVGGSTEGLAARSGEFVGAQLRRYATGQRLANVIR